MTNSVEAKNIVDVLIANGHFKRLVDLVTRLGLVDILKSQAAQTIFAPSDEVFNNLPQECGQKMDEKATLLRHVLGGITVLAADVIPGPVETLGGEEITLFETDNGGVGIKYKKNHINVVAANIMASNGVIHVIDEIILPSKFPTLNSFLIP